MGGEDFVAGVFGVDFVVKGGGAVSVCGSVGGFAGLDSGVGVDVGVVEWVDVDGESAAVVGEFRGAGDCSKVEGGGIVVSHGTFVVGIIVVNQAHFFNRILDIIKFLEYGEDFLGD